MTTGQLPKMIGTPIKRKEDPRLMTGGGKFTDDVQLRGMLHMAVLRSIHAHARIKRIDTSRAAQHPDVVAVMTGEEAERRVKTQLPLIAIREDMKTRSRWPLAVGVANYVGDPLAAVVATSREAAKDALELIDVDYEPLPAVVDLEAAAKETSPLVHEEMGTNICVSSWGKSGDPDGAFRDADGVVSVRLEEPRIAVNPMEPRAVVASYERGTGNLTVWDTAQAIHRERSELAEVLGFPENKLRVIAIDVGGGFGVKHPTYQEPYIAALFSMQLLRPVKWLEDRGEHFISTDHGRGQVQYVEAAYKNDGTVLGLRVQFYVDLGAYCHGSSHSVAGVNTPTLSPGMYRIQNVDWATCGVFTNKVPFGPYRGYGKGEPTYMIERVIDLISRRLDMDPAEVRRKNFVPKDAFPYTSAMGLEYDSGDYQAALDRALELVEYDKLKEEQKRLRAQGTLMGIGIATNVERATMGPSTARVHSSGGFGSAVVRVDPAGKVTVLTGFTPHGQGHETTFSQIIADVLGVPFDEVEIVYGDTSMTPHAGIGTAATRSLVIGGTAIIKAGERVKDKARQIAAVLLQIDADHVVLEDGKFFAEDIPGRYVTWADVGNEAYQARNLPRDMERGLEFTAFWEPPSFTFPFSAHIAVVYVDADTGEVKLAKHVCVDDSGNVVNPMVVEGQVHGGLAQGIGEALQEQAEWDENGQMITGSFMDYAMPIAEDFPMFTTERTVTPSPHNPLGAKGGGETGILAAVPAVVNAVVDALSHLGVTEIDIPVKSEKVWRLLREKGMAGRPTGGV